MAAAVDTNILLDIVLPDQPFAEQSYELLAHFMKGGPLIICDVVYGELAAVFGDRELLNEFLLASNIRIVPNSTSVLWETGCAWRLYNQARHKKLQCAFCGFAADYVCNKCGNRIRTRQHIISDFFIGAHALENSDRLLTRDRGIFQRYFPTLITQQRL